MTCNPNHHTNLVEAALRHEDAHGVERRRVAGIPCEFIICADCADLLMSAEDDGSAVRLFVRAEEAQLRAAP